MTQLIIKSPSNNKSIELVFDRELHFGPYLFKATMVGFKVLDTLDTITDSICWSDNDRYIAIVEVIYDDVNKKNISNLKLIDADTGMVTKIDSRDGQIVPKSISDSGVITY